MSGIYTKEFYDTLHHGAFESARVILPEVLKVTNFQSVVDVGCGSGPWLHAAKTLGVQTLRGMDGPWAPVEQITALGADFIPVDFATAKRIPTKTTFDLAISLEMGEHLPESQADLYIRTLARLGTDILFSSAQPGQGGTVGHINEQPAEYWHTKFAAQGLFPYDIRFIFAKNPKVCEWYRKNIYLYRRYPSLNSFFPNVFWINLDRRTDRRERMESRLAQFGIKAKRFVAFDGSALEKPEGFDGAPGGWGFNLSHLGVYEQARKQGLDPVLILEDDAVFPVEFVKWAGEFLREVPSDWELLYFGCNTRLAKLKPVSPRVARVTDAYTTHAYALRASTAEYFLNHPDRHRRTLDAILHDEQKNLKTYCCTPSIATQEAGFSDILNRECDYSGAIL